MTNPLVNVLTPKVRAWLYALLFVASTLFTIWQASDGDWRQAVAGGIAALLGLVAASNASPTQVPEPANPFIPDNQPPEEA